MARRGPPKSIEDEEFLEAVRSSHGPVATVREVTDQVGSTRQNVYNHLERLAGEGKLHKKKVGASAAVWWVG